MWLEAIITREDLTQVMAQFLPVKIHLPEEGKEESDRWIMLHPATKVALVPDQGLQVTCPAEFRWPIVGLGPTVKIDELSVLMRPQVVEKNKGNVLEFSFELEEADFHSIPAFLDGTIIKAINAALANTRPGWNFTETLTRKVGLGKMFEPVEALSIAVQWGKHRINTEALTLVMSFDIGFVRGD
jgi:hypothetical protein